MKLAKFFSIASTLMLILIISSCSKENLTETTNNIPEVNPTETIGDELRLDRVALRSITAQIVGVSNPLDVDGNIALYNLLIESSVVDGEAYFAGDWIPSNQETALQNMDYSGVSVITLSQDMIDALAVDFDPNNPPTLTMEDIMAYDAAGMTIGISNVTSTSADVELSGSIQEADGNVVNISGTFTAEVVYQ